MFFLLINLLIYCSPVIQNTEDESTQSSSSQEVTVLLSEMVLQYENITCICSQQAGASPECVGACVALEDQVERRMPPGSEFPPPKRFIRRKKVNEGEPAGPEQDSKEGR